MTLDQGIVAVSLILASTAAVLNTVATLRGPYALRMQCGVRAVLAVLYVVAYVWLLTHIDQRARWSQTVSGMSLIAWVAVWNMPAVIALRLEKRPTKLTEHDGAV